MRKTAPVLLSLSLVCACQTGAFSPIEIDLSKRTPTASTTAAVSAIATPAPTATSLPTSPAVAPDPANATPTPTPAMGAGSALAVALGVAPATATPEQIVESQISAYNRHDVEGFCRFFAPDAVIYDFPDHPRLSGIEQIRGAYVKEFAQSAASQIAVSTRIPQGRFVLDHETMSGIAGQEATSLIVISEVREGKIRRVWVLR